MAHRPFKALLEFLKTKGLATTQIEQAQLLGLTQPQVSQFLKEATAPMGEKLWKKIFRRVYELGYKQGERDTGSKLMTGFVETFDSIPQTELANALGLTQPAISSWLSGSVSPSKTNFERLLSLHVIRLVEPVIEFEEIEPLKKGSSWHFHADPERQTALREKLRNQVGLYVFYDSAGRVTYIGKTTRCLWGEPRQRLQAIVNRPFYKPTKASGIQQGDVARYLSAYRVRVAGAIHNLEVLMLRAIPNDAANTNTGKFQYSLGKRRK